MPRPDGKKLRRKLFNYSYVVLAILLLITTGATVAYHQNFATLEHNTGGDWTAVVFLIGFCVSLLIFGMTHREATARARLSQKAMDLIEAQRQNRLLLDAEQNLRIAAEQANLAKDGFLGLVSHELKTPLNAIAGWNRILRTQGLSDETRQTAIDKIDKNLRMQASIVEELLDFSDVMSSGPLLAKQPVDIGELVTDAVSAVGVAAFQKTIAMVTNFEIDGEVSVAGDRERLKIAFVNVISNAVKFTPEGGNVSISASAVDGAVKCVIADNGLGIRREMLPHIFEQYRQSEHATTRRFGGLGLGLTIAKHIVQLHDGTIEARSPGAGGGSVFTITLPSNTPDGELSV
jgi:signal transduction histidine kinase